ncbi:MAG: hypothetical protein IJ177_00700 [Fibrobacter sp.]|uniref:hypothetical protein n=1 Tax=Fibrobacter sp. TaxID=35828 RepID=UPI0025BD3F32|nr:hypothetical protein [Fibrobacter sp.]MBQ9224698.1 hypothetical protein [Fibrobacter sp.]
MFYKHWKKIALSLTALFWAGCDDSASSSEVVLYGCPDDICAPAPESSSVTENPVSSSSETTKTSSSSIEESSSSSEFVAGLLYGVEPPDSIDVKCFPMDSSVSYFPNDYSADNAKFWKEEAAKHDAVDKIDSIKQTLAETPTCLENLRMELDQFVALYGAPTIIRNAVEKCIDGTIRPSEEYAKFLKMKEQWEANLPALDEELKKVYEDKMKEIEERINKCLNGD